MTLLRAATTMTLLGGLVWMVELDELVAGLREADAGWLLLATLLMPVNIALESFKWKVLLQTNSRPSTIDALGSVLAGYALGLFTPARAGDYAGRALYLPNDRYQTVVQTALDRLTSMVIYVGAGVIAVAVSVGAGIIGPSTSWLVATGFGGVCGLGLTMLLSRPALLHRLLSRLSRSDRWIRGIRFLRQVDLPRATRLFVLSGLRYFVFATQLVALVIAFGGPPEVELLYVCTSLVFFVKTMIPQFTFADLGIRETAAVFFFGLVGVGSATALNASLVLFALNLLLPAVVGAVFVPRLRISTDVATVIRTRLGWSAR